MGLMQFLAVGRSVDRIRDHPTRYKMMQQNFLPKFGPANSDDKQIKTKRVAAARQPRAHRKAVVPGRALLAVRRATASIKSRFFKQVVETLKFRNPMQSISLESTPASFPADAAATQPFPQGRWTVLSKTSFFANPFVPKRKSNAERQPIQAELALDSIKPIRNDLREADFEENPASGDVMISTVSTGADPKPSEEAAPDAKTPQPAWGQLAAQFFGAEKA